MEQTTEHLWRIILLLGFCLIPLASAEPQYNIITDSVVSTSSSSNGTFNNTNLGYLNNTQTFTGNNSFIGYIKSDWDGFHYNVVTDGNGSFAFTDRAGYNKWYDIVAVNLREDGHSVLTPERIYTNNTIIGVLENPLKLKSEITNGGTIELTDAIIYDYENNSITINTQDGSGTPAFIHLNAETVFVSNNLSVGNNVFGKNICYSNGTNAYTYNSTYAGLINNASYLSTYNSTYAGILNNASYVTTNEPTQYQNAFAGDKFYQSELHDILYASDRRFSVLNTSGTFYYLATANSGMPYISKLFDGTYNNYVLRVDNTTNVTIQINLSAKGEYASWGITYPAGYIYISYYFGMIPCSVSGRVIKADGTSSALTGFTNVSGTSVPLQRLTVPGLTFTSVIELVFTANMTASCYPNEVEYNLGRPTGSPTPMFNKNAIQTLTYSTYYKNSSGATYGLIHDPTRTASFDYVNVSHSFRLNAITLPACSTTYNGTIARNSTKPYYCDGAVWNALY